MANQKICSSFLAIIVVALLALPGSTAFRLGHKPRQVATSVEAVSRRDALAGAASAALVAGVPFDALAAAAPTPRAKREKETAAKFYFNGLFRDLKHPDGYRIVAGAIGKKGSIIMQDSPDSPVIEIPMTATRDDKTGAISVDMDLSKYEKGYPNSVVATVKKDGCLQFPDGNRWKKEGGIAGVYIDGFAPYPKFRRIVVPGENGVVAIKMVSGKASFEAPGIDMGRNGLYVDFPGNKRCLGKVNAKQGTIRWADGNVWTKV